MPVPALNFWNVDMTKLSLKVKYSYVHCMILSQPGGVSCVVHCDLGEQISNLSYTIYGYYAYIMPRKKGIVKKIVL